MVEQCCARPLLSNASLEALLIAIMQLQATNGMKLMMRPEDVLRPWVVQQIPKPQWKES